jgi:predicted dehydrogenase
MKKINVAVIGTGHLGSRHLKVYNELTNKVNIIGICDIKSDVLDSLALQYQTKAFKNYTDIPQIDAVNICTPTSSHFEIAEYFLKKKVHTFIEKPIALTVKEGEKLTRLAKSKKCKLQVGHIERFNAAFESIKYFATKPLFIECHRLNHFPNRSLDIGVVMDLMIHDIDIILGLIRSPLKRLDAVGVNVLTSLEDIASVRLNFANGCVCNLTASRVSDEVLRKIRIFQKDTYISLDYVKQEAFIYKKQAKQIVKHSLPIEKEEPLKKELEHFIDCIVHNKKPIVSGEEATEALKVALAISQQIWKRKNT